MATRRMFSLSVTDTDTFLELPASAQCLYFHLGMHADDDGFIAFPRKITVMANCAPDDLKLLIAKGFIIPFESGICAVRDWKINNYIQKDRYQPTRYRQEKCLLETGSDGAYLLQDVCIQNVSKLDAQDRLGKNRLDTLSSELPDESTDAPKQKKTFEHEENPYKAARWLADQIEARMPTCKPYTESVLQSWAAEFDRCNRLDGHPWTEINDVLFFSQSDSFWQQNILSGGKFRKQYITLLAKMNGGKP